MNADLRMTIEIEKREHKLGLQRACREWGKRHHRPHVPRVALPPELDRDEIEKAERRPRIRQEFRVTDFSLAPHMHRAGEQMAATSGDDKLMRDELAIATGDDWA